MGQSSSKAAPQILPPELANSGFPRRFVATYIKSWTKITVLLSEPGESDAPAYALTMDQGWYGDMTLHGGPSKEHAPVASVKPAGKLRQDFSIMLPAVPPHGQPRTEILRNPISLKRDMFWFAMEVGEGQDRHVERYEWRRSHGSEVKSLAGGSRWGFKLVRVGGDNNNNNTKSPSHVKGPDGRADGVASDGNEVVAVWVDASILKPSTVGEFELRGSGATGELGQLWTIMAAMSCMCIWQREMQGAVTAGLAAS